MELLTYFFVLYGVDYERACKYYLTDHSQMDYVNNFVKLLTCVCYKCFAIHVGFTFEISAEFCLCLKEQTHEFDKNL